MITHGHDRQPLYRVLSFRDWTEPERPCGRTDAERLFRFAECSDGTEVLIELKSGAVRVGGRNGRSVPETGRQIARSFTDFLLRALDGGPEPYLRRKVPCGSADRYGAAVVRESTIGWGAFGTFVRFHTVPGTKPLTRPCEPEMSALPFVHPGSAIRCDCGL